MRIYVVRAQDASANEAPLPAALQGMITKAADRVGVKSIEFVNRSTFNGEPIHAVIWSRHRSANPEIFPETDAPVALIDFGPKFFKDEAPPGVFNPTFLRLKESDIDAGIEKLAAWLLSITELGISVQQRRMIEVVLDQVRRLLEDDRFCDANGAEQVAQAQGAHDTAAAQLRTPKPSRRVLSWALSQLSAFPGGLLTGLAAQYLPMLIHELASR